MITATIKYQIVHNAIRGHIWETFVNMYPTFNSQCHLSLCCLYASYRLIYLIGGEA